MNTTMRISLLSSSSNKALFIETYAYKNMKMWLTWWEIIPQEDWSNGSHPGLSLLMTVQQIPLTKQQIKVELQEINPWVRNPPKKKQGKIRKMQFTISKQLNKKTYMAPNEPFLWQTMTQKAGQVWHQHQWTQTILNLTEYRQVKYVPKISTRYHISYERKRTSLSITSITLAQVEEIVIRLSRATFKEAKIPITT